MGVKMPRDQCVPAALLCVVSSEAGGAPLCVCFGYCSNTVTITLIEGALHQFNMS